jgi:spore coat polysaccharide biosynthesis predicted glycosyltransferase SpsG
MFESVLTKTPTAVIKTYDHQKYAIKELEKFETINYLGYINRINKSKLFNFIQLLKSNRNKTKYIKKNIKNTLIDSFGLKRVTELILKKINEK